MSDNQIKAWVITLPQTVLWEDYLKELEDTADGRMVLNYRTRYLPEDMKPGDRCYLVHRGKIRGWMSIVGLEDRKEPWMCQTTHRTWPPGKYIQRSGPFHLVDGPKMIGFRGIRRYHP